MPILVGCTDDDSFTTSTANTLIFSTDSVKMDTVFSTVPTPTRTFWVYNRSGDGIRCTNIRLTNGNQTGFRVNVDGEYLSPESGFKVSNVEIRDKDSIRVFVELTSPVNGKEGPQPLEDNLVFLLESGVEQKVNLNAYTWDATMLKNIVVKGDTTIDSPTKPVVIYGGIKVDSNAVLRIAAGTTLYFHANAGIDVYGRMITEGTADNNVILRGDRTDRMFDYLPYDMVSGQWNGIRFNSSSYDNKILFTDIHSTFDGIVCDSSDVTRLKLQLYNSTVPNCQGYGLKTTSSVVDVRNSQITNTLNNCVCVLGGEISLLHCTLAQFYPFDSNRGVALRYSNHEAETPYPLTKMDCINTIVTGYADDQIAADNKNDDTPFAYRFVNSLLRTPKIEDDQNVVNIVWENVEDTAAISGEENFKLVDIDMQRYDFHLSEKSPAINAASPENTLPEDRDGRSRDILPDIGCYEYFKEENNQ